jgi:Lysylphosphatidylglycerol synthase TM region
MSSYVASGFRALADVSKRWLIVGSTVAGIVALVWTVMAVGPRALVDQSLALGVLLPAMLFLMGVRFALQAWGWQLAMNPPDRPAFSELLSAVVAGEGVGYLAWGPLSREPMKVAWVSHRLSASDALASVTIERVSSTAATTALAVVGVGIVAARHNHVTWLVVGALATMLLAGIGWCRSVGWLGTKRGNQLGEHGDALTAQPGWAAKTRVLWTTLCVQRPVSTIGIIVMGAAQEATNVGEAFLVLVCLGAGPTLASVLILEGASRLLNVVTQFVPGKIGVSEAGSAALSGTLQLGSGAGLSLALARRVRALLWSAIGLGLAAMRTRERRVPLADFCTVRV